LTWILCETVFLGISRISDSSCRVYPSGRFIPLFSVDLKNV
jgi:hypothetical protein